MFGVRHLSLILALHVFMSLGFSFRRSAANLTYTTVYQFDTNGTWIENQAHRPNGNLLVTRVDLCELWEINPSARSGSLVANFSDCTAATGITKVGHDVYAVVTGAFNNHNFSITPGKPSLLWKIDYASCETDDDQPKVSVVTNTTIAFPNGATTLNKDTVLLTDSYGGSVWKVDIESGASSIAISDPTMARNATSTGINLGVNGIKIHGGYLYYTNTAKGLFCRIPIDSNAHATGPAQILAQQVAVDDFTILGDGTAYIANPTTFVYEAVPPYAGFSIAAGAAGSFEVAGATSVEFGSTSWDRDILYVTTSGSQVAPVNGRIEPGKVVAVSGLKR